MAHGFSLARGEHDVFSAAETRVTADSRLEVVLGEEVFGEELPRESV